jgi:hypothetical protein
MTFISPIYHTPLICNKNNFILNKIIASDVLLTGVDIGIPLNIFSNIFTNIHYGYDITSIENILALTCVGYYTYTKDRYSDAIEYQKNSYNTTKIELYNNILSNKKFYEKAILASFFSFFAIILSTNDGNDFEILSPYLILLLINGEYKLFKKYLSIFKPVYIATMWTIATIFLPCIMYDHNYDIINYPIDYLPCFLTLFATSNYADIKDINEDKMNNITTLPIKIGERNSNIINIFSLLLSNMLFFQNSNFDKRLIVNSIFELQNFVAIYLISNSTF